MDFGRWPGVRGVLSEDREYKEGNSQEKEKGNSIPSKGNIIFEAHVQCSLRKE